MDQTAGFSALANGATGSPAAALGDGTHTITAVIKDVAGNAATATAVLVVDSTPPQIIITQPADGLFTNALSLVVTGTVVDGSPVTVTIEGQAVPLQGNTFTSAGITLGTNSTQAIHIIATDAAGNSTPRDADDQRRPHAAYYHSQYCSATQRSRMEQYPGHRHVRLYRCRFRSCELFTAHSVSTEGANQVVTGTATDRAGNTAQLPVTARSTRRPRSSAPTQPRPQTRRVGTIQMSLSPTCARIAYRESPFARRPRRSPAKARRKALAPRPSIKRVTSPRSAPRSMLTRPRP